MDNVHEKRLLKLANELRNLPPKLFNFSVFIERGTNTPKKALEVGGGCGTVGCAIGWCPTFFPRHFRWKGIDTVGGVGEVINKETGEEGFKGAAAFFGLTEEESEYLFRPDGLYYYPYGEDSYGNQRTTALFGHHVGGGAKPGTVADHIERFVEQKKSGAWDKKVRRAIIKKNEEWQRLGYNLIEVPQ